MIYFLISLSRAVLIARDNKQEFITARFFFADLSQLSLSLILSSQPEPLR